ncbi:GNAT family N-acetyltransferase [Deinococcus irradiatisoli]|uniref:GNAT family N-acetyltransferase n=1 Tax=Deinococcus irradiatisoli TaxID=2202254 RepID=A0A2Z3JH71_9DEIO|nr:GNAT family protein [Deinococcus irradiatisoli]AWN23376.1 GNAT family N-acetyltransferase [Deinococcus irradiatisoli]
MTALVAALPTLRTGRLTVRPLLLADAPEYTAYHNDPDVARFQSWTLPYPLETAEAQASRPQVLSGEWAALILEATQDSAVLGNLSVRLSGHRTAEVGFTLARRWWGQGYAHEGLRALLRWLFSRQGADLHRVHASLDPRNVRSAALLERAGFRFEGCSLKSYWHQGEWTDDAHYALLQSEWRDGEGDT